MRVTAVLLGISIFFMASLCTRIFVRKQEIRGTSRSMVYETHTLSTIDVHIDVVNEGDKNTKMQSSCNLSDYGNSISTADTSKQEEAGYRLRGFDLKFIDYSKPHEFYYDFKRINILDKWSNLPILLVAHSSNNKLNIEELVGISHLGIYKPEPSVRNSKLNKTKQCDAKNLRKLLLKKISKLSDHDSIGSLKLAISEHLKYLTKILAGRKEMMQRSRDDSLKLLISIDDDDKFEIENPSETKLMYTPGAQSHDIYIGTINLFTQFQDEMKANTLLEVRKTSPDGISDMINFGRVHTSGKMLTSMVIDSENLKNYLKNPNEDIKEQVEYIETLLRLENNIIHISDLNVSIQKNTFSSYQSYKKNISIIHEDMSSDSYEEDPLEYFELEKYLDYLIELYASYKTTINYLIALPYFCSKNLVESLVSQLEVLIIYKNSHIENRIVDEIKRTIDFMLENALDCSDDFKESTKPYLVLNLPVYLDDAMNSFGDIERIAEQQMRIVV